MRDLQTLDRSGGRARRATCASQRRSPCVTPLNAVGRPFGGVGPTFSAMPTDPVMDNGVPIPLAASSEKSVTT